MDLLNPEASWFRICLKSLAWVEPRGLSVQNLLKSLGTLNDTVHRCRNNISMECKIHSSKRSMFDTLTKFVDVWQSVEKKYVYDNLPKAPDLDLALG